MDLGDTIAAEATPPGRGALRVVRLSGPRAIGILKTLFESEGPVPWDRPRSLCLGSVGLPGAAVLDRALAVCFPAPASLTGEDVVEIQTHGSPGVVGGILDLAMAAGARAALPGEFSYRAYLNGKMSVMEAEAVNALVEAQTEGQAQRLVAGLQGRLEGRLREVLGTLMDLRADLEARIDFPEDMEGEASAGTAGAPSPLPPVVLELERMLAAAPSLRYLREGWRVALVGPVNSGKSSLFNALLRRERALVTPHPGTTRDVLEESVQIGGYPLVLMDTAGVRQATDPVEALGMERGLHMASQADGVLLVFDGSRGWEAEAQSVLEQLQKPPLAVLANKADRGVRCTGSPEGTLEVSALTGHGLDGLSRLLGGWMESSMPSSREALVTERQLAAVRRALEGCREAQEALELGRGEDLAAEGLLRAQIALDELLSGGSAEDLYDRIFARFCIGK